ncbi:hypothetical protein I6H07_07415 [Hafnia alvei]|uniref:hypothetical protein n=1 Tax=Hafnia alvei TaxID=569 RepID=UPI000B73B929|nr:hypothetical protein [Hafnia alvei]MBI0275665.1 hypothetical protein [Hafnia alvei]PNK98350.1 hypothetical protein CEQ28_012565 [Hafnia alvei]
MAEFVNPRGGGIYVHVDFPGAQTVQFKRPVVRRAFAKIGKEIQKTARDRVSSHRGSLPGQDPGWESGELYKSIGFYVPRATGRRPGFMVAIAPNQKRGRGMTPIQAKDGPNSSGFYPAYLQFGVRRGARAQIKKGKHGKEVRVKKAGASGGSGWRIAPRANFMTEALADKKSWAERTLFNALKRAVIPQVIK